MTLAFPTPRLPPCVIGNFECFYIYHPISTYVFLIFFYNMAWPNPFRRRTPATRDAWGYVFELSPSHLSPVQMDPMKYSYDTLGERAYARLTEICKRDRFTELRQQECSPQPAALPSKPKQDLYASLREHAPSDKVLGDLWGAINDVPCWVDWNQIARGQDCFYRYGGAILTGLAFHSLVGGMVNSMKSLQTNS